MLRLAMTALGRGIRRKARLGVSYDFLFMRASGDQIAKIAALVDAAANRPVIGRIVPFDQTPRSAGSPEHGRGSAARSSSATAEWACLAEHIS